MQIEAMVGQLLVGGIPDAGFDARTLREYHHYHLYSFQLTQKNMPNTADIQALTNAIATYGKQHEHQPLVLVDQEGGRIQPLPDSTPNFPSAQVLGYTGNRDLVWHWARMQGDVLRALGINTILSPCLDILEGETSQDIGSRSFGSNPRKVAALGRAALRGFRSAGIVSGVKYFPGRGQSNSERHVLTSRESLWQNDILPFRIAIQAHVPALIMSPCVYDAIDSRYPAILSYLFMTGLLRRRLGYRGVIMADAVALMTAVPSGRMTDGVIRFLQAGGDLIVAHEYWREIHERIVWAVQRKKIPLDRITEAAGRITQLRAVVATLQKDTYTPLDEQTCQRTLTEIALAAQENGAPMHDDATFGVSTARRFHLADALDTIRKQLPV